MARGKLILSDIISRKPTDENYTDEEARQCAQHISERIASRPDLFDLTTFPERFAAITSRKELLAELDSLWDYADESGFLIE